MYLSMWMLAHGLAGYRPEPHISGGEMCIRNASLLYQGDRISPYTVYICPSENYISTLTGKIICVNRNDYIVLENDSLEEIFDQVCQMIDTYMEWDLQVLDAIRENCSLQEVLEFAVPLLQKMLCVVNTAFFYDEIVGVEYCTMEEPYLSQMKKGGSMPLDHVEMFMQSYPFYSKQKDSYLYENKLNHDLGLMKSLFLKEQYIGTLMMFLGKEPVQIWEHQMFEILYQQVVIWLDGHWESFETPEHVKVLENLLNSPQILAGKYNGFFQQMGWKPSDRKYLSVISRMDESGIAHRLILRCMAARFPHCMTLPYQDTLLFLTDIDRASWKDLTEELDILLPRFHLTMGVSYPFENVYRLSMYLRQAQIALQYKKGAGTSIYYCADNIVEYSKNILLENLDVDMVDPALGTLKKYDEIHHTQYFETLYEYLAQERSLVKTAAVLKIHINTLKYRLKRLEEIEHFRLDDEKERARLSLSFLLLR